ncbi:MAG: FMN-binding protein [Clostridiales bacterium]|nr:FMN-binding protein [Clostridiales bacterium]
MDLFLNIGMAWVGLILTVLMTIIYFFRVLNKKSKIEWIKRLNRSLRKSHKLLGVTLIVVGLVHGIHSSDNAIGLNFGTFTWIFSILLGLSYMFRKKFAPQKMWMVYHRVITVVFVGLLVIHIIDVGGFIIDDILFAPKTQTQEVQIAKENPTAVPIITSTESTSTTTKEITTQAPTDVLTPTIKTKYIDGVYIGTAKGYRLGLVVEVEIVDDHIVRVEVIEHNEVKKRFWGFPVKNIPLWIIEAQSTDVDTVSGATWTSQGIINATDAALEKALNS